MSKLYKEYLKLKEEKEDTIYLFKSGIFYIALERDAEKLAELFLFKITNLNSNIIKCGFPENRLNFYVTQLETLKQPFEIIDLNYSKIDNYSDYLNNVKIKHIIDKIVGLDMDNTSFKQAFDFLEKIQLEIRQNK